MARWLVTGAGGMLGRELVALLASPGAESGVEPSATVQVIGLGHRDLDIADAAAVDAAFDQHRPDVVVNCAAWTAVDDAEAHESAALRINGLGAANVAGACARAGARLLQISTDYVFAGDATVPYPEDAVPAPRTAYGRTKLAGEWALQAALPSSGYIVRTAWLYGRHGPNFVRTMIGLAGSRPTVDVVDDQVGQPTWTRDLAEQVIRLGSADAPPGIYHATSAGLTSWYGLAREVFALLGADPDRVRPATGAAYTRPAPRPAFSVLGHDRWAAAGLDPIRGWRAALAEAFPSLLAATASS